MLPITTEGAQPHDATRDLAGGFLITLIKSRREAIAGRAASGIEQEWTEDEEHYQGIDDANRAYQNANQLHRGSKQVLVGGKAPAAPTRSVVFLNITRPYVDAASARVADMLLPTDDRAWEIKATPLPDLPPQRMTALAAAMGLADPVQAQAELAAVHAEAAAAAARMQDAIEDPLVESNWHGEVRQVIEDCARIGTGVLKGPFPVVRKRSSVRRNPLTQLMEIVRTEDICPASKRLDPWNFFPDPSCGEDIHNGSYTWERDYVSRRQLKELMADASYDAVQLQAALKEGPSRTRDGTEAVFRPAEDEYELWIFYGHCAREQLAARGIELDEDAEERLPTMAVLVNDRLVKCALNPSETGSFPYDMLAWQRRPGLPYGVGVSRHVRTPQRMLNGGARAMMDNSGLSAAPQIVIGNGIVPADGNWALTPGKAWRAEPTASVGDVRGAFHGFVVPSVQQELMNIIQFAQRIAEDVTGLPAMLQGIRGDAPDTLGGMQMQNNNATSVLRRLAKRFDDYITRPHIQRYFEWMMTYSENESIKGDFEIEVRASSALVERDAQQQFLMTLLQVAANPVYELDPAKLAAELCKGQRLDPKNFQLTDEQKAQRAQQGQDPAVQAKARLLEAQARKTDADATNRGMETLYSGVQTAQVMAMAPQIAGLADGLARSVGFQDQDTAPIYPQGQGGNPPPDGPEPVIPAAPNTDPRTPPNPASPLAGVRQGIETPEADGLTPL